MVWVRVEERVIHAGREQRERWFGVGLGEVGSGECKLRGVKCELEMHDDWWMEKVQEEGR